MNCFILISCFIRFWGESKEAPTLKNVMDSRSCLYRNTPPGIASPAYSWRCITNKENGFRFCGVNRRAA